MKKILIYSSLALVTLVVGCTKSFDSINTDPKQVGASQFDPNLLLATAEVGYAGTTLGYSGAILFQSMWVQILASAAYPTYYSNGDKYVASQNLLTYDASIWGNAFTAAGQAAEIQNFTATKPELSNLSGVSLIVELLNFELLTDTYGDIPYSQALQAKSTGITLPVYDKQQDIYNSMLAKLDSVIPTLDASKALPTNDIIYKGDIASWQKFGYSLMLRMAMRLTKADAATAQKYAEKAFAGGAFTSNADNALVAFDNADGYTNGNSSALVTPEDYGEARWGQVLISFLKSTNDPRLPVIAEVPQPGLLNSANESLPGDPTPANQLGLPSGYDQNGTATDISHAPGYPGPNGAVGDVNPIGKYSRPTTSLYLALNTPAFVLTYTETELLFAEAAVRGWSVGSTASQHYSNGVQAALLTYGSLNGTTPISAATAAAYAAANPLDVSSTTNSLAEINTQFWASTGTFFNFIEAWNNWRRSGYPVLTPVNYTGNFSNGTIPRREIYPGSEASTNGDNFKAAVANLTGGDNWTSRVWWDQ